MYKCSQEHTARFITNLLAPPVPENYTGDESHLIGYAPMFNVLIVGIGSIDCVQIFSLLGLVISVTFFCWFFKNSASITSFHRYLMVFRYLSLRRR